MPTQWPEATAQGPRGDINDTKLETNQIMYEYFHDGFQDAYDADGPRGDKDTARLEA